MQDLPYLNIGIRDIKAKWVRHSGVHGKKNFYPVSNGRDSSNLISLSVPTTTNYFYDLSLFSCFFFNVKL